MNRTTQAISTLWRNRPRYRTVFLVQVVLIALFLTLSLYIHAFGLKHEVVKRSSGTFGGFDERPMTEKCYKQERVATLFAVFLGLVGADHWYAQHWVLAIFKLLTGGGLMIWATIDVAFWIVGGFYGTPGCGGGCSKEWLC
ncbi:uncharacterized protein N0V89_007068 [Didymosphaeria variabile]|uniref:TM2 domain-containing protein n=1 Tax=Didymosphaeria variabile TaxID=1932322 RepID=A0A9W8XKS5_9PLEO|nr:uncharacterized protein N0V89_007068 [Didymosphaeria variabile]KAJ4351725.1 hypothetical protein N0V89_007068 [Didymosphaeria variabile]